MKEIYLGHNKQGEAISLDFEKEKINFILLFGQTGSGKSIFHRNLYRELAKEYLPQEIGFVFFDMTRVEFYGWSSDFLIEPVVSDAKEIVKILQELAELKTDKKIFIHIEECDVVYENRQDIENVFKKLKEQDNIYIVYSTSRLNREYLSQWMKDFIDLKVVFAVASEDDSIFLLGSDMANHFSDTGERVLVFNERQIFCWPFLDKEVEVLEDFKL